MEFLKNCHIITYYVMGKIDSEGHIRNSETFLWARGEAEGLIKWSRWFLICPRGDFNNIHNFISRLRINLCPGIHKRQERYNMLITCHQFFKMEYCRFGGKSLSYSLAQHTVFLVRIVTVCIFFFIHSRPMLGLWPNFLKILLGPTRPQLSNSSSLFFSRTLHYSNTLCTY